MLPSMSNDSSRFFSCDQVSASQKIPHLLCNLGDAGSWKIPHSQGWATVCGAQEGEGTGLLAMVDKLVQQNPWVSLLFGMHGILTWGTSMLGMAWVPGTSSVVGW